MNLQKQIKDYIATQPEPKRGEMQQLHHIVLALMPKCKLWFLDGKSREFYQIGISANTTGIAVYIMGVSDKKHLAQKFGPELGKASVTGYCIKFKTLADIKIDRLKAAIQYGIEQTSIQH